MILAPDILLRRVTSVVLTLYVGAFLAQALCVLPSSHVGPGMEGPSTAVHASSPAAVPSSSMAAHSASPHGAHSGALGESHSGLCAVVACGSAIATSPDHGLGLMSRVSNAFVVYLGGIVPPDAEMVLPPPRLG